MANDLTGDFDVVIQFSVPAVNRVLAGMHQLDRFPHSITARVEDNYHPGRLPDRPTLVSLVDAAGEAISNHQRIGRPLPVSGAFATSPSASFLDAIVNPGIGGIEIPTLEPSHFQGRAQLQIFPPTVQIADSSGTRLAITLQMLIRYFPDPGTSPAAQFIRGELHLTAPIDQVASQSGNIIEINVKAHTVGVRFTPQWSSSPLTAQDIGGIELFIRNALKTSFLPSSSPLPSTIRKVQFKTLSAGGGAAAMLLNMNEVTGNPATANAVLVTGNDQFVFGVSAEYAKAAFQPTLDNILSQPIDPVKFDIESYVHTWHITYIVTLKAARLEFQSNWMVLVLEGHAHTGRTWLPDFDFTVRQKLGLAPNGATARLTLGEISLHTTSTIANLFTGPALGVIRKIRDRALAESGANTTVGDMLDAYRQLGAFLDSLLKPPRKRWFQARGYDLAYTAAEIRQSGIVLHGSLSLGNWFAPHVEFEQVPPNPGSHPGLGTVGGVLDGPNYSALRSWIPGGTIQRYEWKHYGETHPGFSDGNTFLFVHSPQLVMDDASSDGGSSGGGAGHHSGIHVTDVGLATTGGLDHSTLCLTVHGTRLSASGPVVAQPVTATICGYGSFPVPGDFTLDELDPPVILLARRGQSGQVEVTGHTEARPDRTGSGAPNLVVHFTNGADASAILSQSLKEAKRSDAPAAIVIVAPPDRVSQLRYVAGVTYASDERDAWAKRFGVGGSRRPLTIIVAPDGKTTWKHEGEIDAASLTAALGKSLSARTPVRSSLLRSGTRIGQPAPNFVFEYAPGHQITFSKLTGREAILFFLKPDSTPIVDALREMKSMADGKSGAAPMVFAILDGKNSHRAQSPLDLGEAVTIVPDPDRKIASAYGITVWPTMLFVDARGVVTNTSHAGGARSAK